VVRAAAASLCGRPGEDAPAALVRSWNPWACDDRPATFVVEQADQPGGPFAVRGLAALRQPRELSAKCAWKREANRQSPHRLIGELGSTPALSASSSTPKRSGPTTENPLKPPIQPRSSSAHKRPPFEGGAPESLGGGDHRMAGGVGKWTRIRFAAQIRRSRTNLSFGPPHRPRKHHVNERLISTKIPMLAAVGDALAHGTD